MARCLIGLGSNLGERAGNLLRALELLRGTPGMSVSGSSSLVETSPVGGPPGQQNYFNAAAVLETDLPPHDVLSSLLAIERQLGRVRREVCGPRTIDLDLLLYDQVVQEAPELTLPHPRLHERRFALAPAAEIAPDWRHPTRGQTLAALLAALPAEGAGHVGLRVFTSPSAMQAHALALRRAGQRIGLVPTMGALHEGHLSLVRIARQRADVVAATIFVNPTQFGPQEDFTQYPRTLDADLAALSAAGCDLAFMPAAGDIYPPGFSTYVEPPAVAQPLEGVCRPGHFRGVATVVLKLFQLVPADFACFGQKDFQQLQVIRRMTRDLNLPLEIVGCPTIREPDGLAMSSRNRYLSPAERQQALALSRALAEAERLMHSGEREVAKIEHAMRNTLAAAGIDRIDYAAVADAETLAALQRIDGPAVALIAAFVGTTRLIDNRVINP
jgi:pantoate--beta-alanine ligase